MYLLLPYVLFVVSDTGKRANLLVGHGATQVLLHVLVSESKEQNPSEELLISIHSILAKLGPKGKYPTPQTPTPIQHPPTPRRNCSSQYTPYWQS